MRQDDKFSRQPFFFNYGGPGEDDAEGADEIDGLIFLCEIVYGDNAIKSSCQIKGINVTVYKFSVHRAILLELPEGTEDEETLELFDRAQAVAKQFKTKKYQLLKNNCVTAVATVLNTLDEKTTEKNVVLPWALDNRLRNYYGEYKGIISTFVDQYRKEASNEWFSLFRSRYWSRNKIASIEGIINHAYGNTAGYRGERTKSSLLKLKWVTENSVGMLIPTDSAPEEFSRGLIQYNVERHYAEAQSAAVIHTSRSLEIKL